MKPQHNNRYFCSHRSIAFAFVLFLSIAGSIVELSAFGRTDSKCAMQTYWLYDETGKMLIGVSLSEYRYDEPAFNDLVSIGTESLDKHEITVIASIKYFRKGQMAEIAKLYENGRFVGEQSPIIGLVQSRIQAAEQISLLMHWDYGPYRAYLVKLIGPQGRISILTFSTVEKHGNVYRIDAWDDANEVLLLFSMMAGHLAQNRLETVGSDMPTSEITLNYVGQGGDSVAPSVRLLVAGVDPSRESNEAANDRITEIAHAAMETITALRQHVRAGNIDGALELFDVDIQERLSETMRSDPSRVVPTLRSYARAGEDVTYAIAVGTYVVLYFHDAAGGMSENTMTLRKKGDGFVISESLLLNVSSILELEGVREEIRAQLARSQ